MTMGLSQCLIAHIKSFLRLNNPFKGFENSGAIFGDPFNCRNYFKLVKISKISWLWLILINLCSMLRNIS
jgi:hypothetical protein